MTLQPNYEILMKSYQNINVDFVKDLMRDIAQKHDRKMERKCEEWWSVQAPL